GLMRWPLRSTSDGARVTLQIGPPRHLGIQASSLSEWADMSGDGRIIALGDRGQGRLVAFDLSREKVLFTAPHESPSRMAISPDGQWIAGSTWNANSNVVRVWQVASGKPVAQWSSVNGSLLAFSPDSQRLIQ